MENNQRPNAEKTGIVHPEALNYLEYTLSKCRNNITTKEHNSLVDLINEYKLSLCYINDKRLCNHEISESLSRDMHDHRFLYNRFDSDAQTVWNRCLSQFQRLSLDNDACTPVFLSVLFSTTADYLWLITSAYNSTNQYNSHPVETIHLIESQRLVPSIAPKAIEERMMSLDGEIAELDKLESINSMPWLGRTAITAVVDALSHEQHDYRLTLTRKELEAEIAAQRNRVISMQNTYYALYATYVLYQDIVRRHW